MKRKLGMQVPTWSNKAISDYTDEELLEYYFKLRFTFIGNYAEPSIGEKSWSSWQWTVDAQEEILKRMGG